MRRLRVAALLALSGGLAGSGAHAQPAEAAGGNLERLVGSKDLQQAETVARRTALLRPADPAALALLAGILTRRGRHGEASDLYTQAVRIDSDNLTLRRDLAASQWRAARLDRARASIESVLAQAPRDRRSLLLAGMIADSQGRHVEAAQLLEDAGAGVWESPESMVAMVRGLYRSGRIDQARRALKRFESVVPGADSQAAAGAAAFDAGDFRASKRLFESAEHSGHADRAGMLFNAALSSYRLGDFSSARLSLEESLGFEPSNDEAWNLLGWSFERGGDTRQALASLQRAIELAPESERHTFDLGTILASHRETWHLAMETAASGLSRHPNSSKLHQLMGLIQMRQQHFLDATASYQRARELAPDSADLHLGLLVALRASGQVERAIEAARASIAKFRQDAALRHQLGRIHSQRAEWGDPQAAALGAARLREAIALDPGMADAHYELGSLALRAGDLPAAHASLRRAAELAPRSGKAHYALARCLRRLGRPAEAARAMRAFRQSSPHRPVPPGGR